MRIALCTDIFAPHVGGTEGVVLALCEEFLKKGHDVAVFTQDRMLDNDEYDKKQNYTIYRTKSYKYPFYPLIPHPKRDKNFEENLRSFSPDVIHSHTPFEIGRWAANMAKKMCVPSVLTHHTYFSFVNDQNAPFSKNNPLHKFFSYIPSVYPKKTASLYSVNTSVSETVLQKEIRELYKLNAPIVLIKNGYDPCSLTFDSLECYKNHYDKNHISLLFVGRIAEEKNIEFSLRVCNRLNKRCVPFTFTLIGEGDIDFYKNKAQELCVSSYTHFLGLKQKEELAQYYTSSDVLLFPSVFDADSLVVKEAASRGIPALVVEHTGASEQIINGVNGFALKNEENGFSDKIEELYRLKTEDFDSFIELRESTKNYHIPTWSEVANTYIGLYTKLLNKEPVK